MVLVAIGAGLIILPLRMFVPSTPGENKYGPEPVVSVRTQIAAVIVGLGLIITFIVGGIVGAWDEPKANSSRPTTHRLVHPITMPSPLPSWSP
jgi:hypothetical protein